jgi:hypothetical protein
MDPPLSYVESPSEAPGINVRERWYGLSPMQHNEHSQHTKENHYLRLVGMIALSLISMYVLMYSMVHSFADVYNSLNQFYMAGLMTAPMVVIEMRVGNRVFLVNQTADRDLRSPVLALHDPPSLRCDPDV